MHAETDNDRVTGRFLPWLIVLGLGGLGYLLHAPRGGTLPDTGTEQIGHDSANEEKIPTAPARAALTKNDGAPEPVKKRPTGITQRPGSTSSTRTQDAQPPAAAAVPAIGEDENAAINRSGRFVKHLFSLDHSGNLWKRLKRADFNPKLRATLEPLQKKLASNATTGIDILYSDYVKDGKNRPENSKILAVTLHLRGKSLSYFASERRGHTWFYDRNGKAPWHTMDRAPFSYSRITSPFDRHRRHPVTGRIQAHEGVDLKGSYGTPIHATGSGIVTFAGWQQGYGRIVIIDHDNGYQTRYAHLSALSAHPGERVKRGQIIGKLGNSGISTGAHLHYEVRIDGVPRDPVTVALPSYPSLPRKEMASWRHYATLYLDTIDTLKHEGTIRK